MTIRFKRIDSAAVLPSRKHNTDSGMDIRSVEAYRLGHGEMHVFATGICAEIPEGYELQVRPRSGLSSRGVLAAFGTVDRGYTGEIRVILYNFGEPVTVNIGDRIAQLVLAPVTIPEIAETDDVGTSERGANGFGSTGIN